MLHQVVTTEKVPITYRVAGMGSRFLAWLIDLGLLAVLAALGAGAGMVLDTLRPGAGGPGAPAPGPARPPPAAGAARPVPAPRPAAAARPRPPVPGDGRLLRAAPQPDARRVPERREVRPAAGGPARSAVRARSV